MYTLLLTLSFSDGDVNAIAPPGLFAHVNGIV
jgi:hypothetical protein